MLELDSLFEVSEGTANKENDDDITSERILKGTFVELCKAGCTIQTLHDYLKEKKGITWTTDEEWSCAIVVDNNEDPPSNLDYSVELIVSTTTTATLTSTTEASGEGEEVEPTPSTTTTTTTKLQVVSKDSDSSSATIQGLILLCAASLSSSSSSTTDVTLKCFARNPRQVLPTFYPASFLPQQQQQQQQQEQSDIGSNVKLSSLKFQFVALDETTCQTVMSCPHVDLIEFRQCTLENPSTALIVSHQDHDDGVDERGGPKRMTISCTMPEFGKLADGLANNTHIEHLELQLHFWLQGPVFESFVNAVSKNQGLRHLSIEYLDINDDGFIALCQALQEHPCLATLTLGFTEKFVDAFRKLTPERRTTRTEAVLELVQSNPNIVELKWPEFQQNPDIMIHVEECLEAKKNVKTGNQ